MGQPHVVILGAGPAGVGAAFRLVSQGRARVSVVERNAWVGGNAGSFELAGMRVDYGSHRLHPACDPEVLRDIRALLGADLLDRPRHGRIRLRGRWLHFPLQPLDLALRLPPSFTLGVAADLVRKVAQRRREPPPRATFASVLEAGLGRTICREFYFPYARKVWGVEPTALAAIQAQRRVSAGSLAKMARKVLAAVPGFKPPGSGRFFYPRHGFGEITAAYCQAARSAGARLYCDTRVVAVDTHGERVHAVHYERHGQSGSLATEHVWSTIPLTALAKCVQPAPPAECVQAADSLRHRAMILIYLVLERERFSAYDAHYFPEADIPITRLSEPKNYRAGHGPANRTVLCAELPCMPDEREWGMSDAALGQVVCQALEAAALPLGGPVTAVVTKRLRQAYPIYDPEYAGHFTRLDRWISQIEGLLTFGRQGLFAHDNTHHALHMAYCAVECLNAEGHFDRERWQAYRRVFETHVVED